MNRILKPVADYWAGRTPRERLLVAGLGILLAAASFWYGLIAPLSTWHDESRDIYTASVERYRSVEAGIARYRSANAGADALLGGDQPVRTIASERALQHGVTIARVLPGEDGRLNLWIDQAESRALIDWLADLDRQYGIAATRITVEREEGGFVSAQMILERVS
ncbi:MULTISPECIES: type II secretion system protein M [Hyphobacterium]|uniref:Type II secretion system protein M n=1 Tax=Hyphobacterium vulgare TaxID=1736751 RepID=A0ABV6ZV54_9PROT